MTNKKQSVKINRAHLSVNLLKRFDDQNYIPQTDEEIKDYLKEHKPKWQKLSKIPVQCWS